MIKSFTRISLPLLVLLLAALNLNAADPTVQATNLNIVGRGSTYLTASWSRGNGQAVLIVVKPTSNTTYYPQDGIGNMYNSSTTWGNGSNLGASNYVVYDGTGTSVTVFGLNPNTSYTFYAYEYNMTYMPWPTDDDYYYYKTTIGSNSDAAYTLCSEPTTGPTSFTASTVGYTTATLTWVGGSGIYDLVTVDESPYTHYAPADGTTYTSSTVWGSGSATGGDNYVVYNSSSSSVSISNLKSATSYRARAYNYNCTGGQQNYYYAGYTYFDFTTDNYPPTISSVASATVCQNSGLQWAYLSGISDGSSAETQTVTITATSSNQTLIPNANISVSYANPNTYGYVYYTPATNQYGTAVITVTVNDNFSSTNTTATTFTVTVRPFPSAATAFSGSTTVCAGGGNVVYIEPAIANATGYTWSVPAGWSIVSGQGTQTLTVSPGATASNGNITVYGTNSNGCGTGTAYSTSVTVNAQPTTPNAGVNQNPICGNTAFLNGNAPGSGNTGTWSVLPGPPAPTIGNASANSTSVTGLANSQNYYFVWTITNGGVCPAKKDTVLLVTDFSNIACTPSANYSYAGNTNSGIAGTICVNTPIQFTDLSVSADTWDWDFDYTGVFSSNSTLQNPTYTYTATGTYTCRLKIHSNTTGLDYTNDQTITVIGPPAAPSSISGIFTGICAGDPNQFNYSVGAVTNATVYNWTYPTGCNLSTNAADYSQISVTFDQAATDGNLMVNAANGCGASSDISMLVQIDELPGAASAPAETGGAIAFCQGQTSVTFTVAPISYATNYIWTLPSGVTGTSTSSSITVDFTSNALSGTIYVYGSNACGDGADNNLAITVNPLPDPAGAVSGVNALDICPLPNSITYSVAPINNAIGYTWNISNGGVIISGAGTNSITVDFSSALTSGTIDVYGTNGCGNGVASAVVNVDFNPVQTADLCIVSVDSAGDYNEIFWQKPVTGNIDSFRVYRRVSAVSNVLVGTVGYNDPAYLVDMNSGADPNSNFEEYTITTVDTCGNESDSTLFHRTMFLAPPVYGANSVTLNWNHYVGQTVNFYRILRDTTGTGTAWEVLDSAVNPNVNVWVDNNLTLGADDTLLYRVDVVWLTSCDPERAVINTSRSNIKSQMINPTTTGMSAQDISEMVAVYPNPAKEVINIEFRNGMKNALVEIYDVTGRMLLKQNAGSSNRITLNTFSFTGGVYFVRLQSDEGKAVKKLVVDK